VVLLLLPMFLASFLVHEIKESTNAGELGLRGNGAAAPERRKPAGPPPSNPPGTPEPSGRDLMAQKRRYRFGVLLLKRPQ